MKKVVVPAFLASLLVACTGTPPCEDEYAAYTMATKFISGHLRSPASADFPNYMASDVTIRPTTLGDGRCAFTVTTYVDAQNGFGATVRKRFIVTVVPDLPIAAG